MIQTNPMDSRVSYPYKPLIQSNHIKLLSIWFQVRRPIKARSWVQHSSHSLDCGSVAPPPSSPSYGSPTLLSLLWLPHPPLPLMAPNPPLPLMAPHPPLPLMAPPPSTPSYGSPTLHSILWLPHPPLPLMAPHPPLTHCLHCAFQIVYTVYAIFHPWWRHPLGFYPTKP